MKSTYIKPKKPTREEISIQLLHAFVNSSDDEETWLAVRSPIALSALDSLSESDRDVLIWYYVEERTVMDIARQHLQFGPMGAMRSIFRQFVHQLRGLGAFRLLDEERGYKPLRMRCAECENTLGVRLPPGGIVRCSVCECRMRIHGSTSEGEMPVEILERARLYRPRPAFNTDAHYRLLKVLPGSSWHVIDNAYYELREKYDPDEVFRHGTAYQRRALELYLELLDEAWISLTSISPREGVSRVYACRYPTTVASSAAHDSSLRPEDSPLQR